MNKPGATGSSESRGDWYYSLFELSMDAMSITTPEGRVVDANQAWLDLFGYTRQDLASLNVRDVYIDPAEREEFIRRMDAEGRVSDEVRFRKKDGSMFICRRSQVARRDESGRIIAYQGVLHDVTEQRRMQQALADELTWRRLLFERSRDGIVILDEDGKVIEANPAFARMLGYSPDELAGLHVWDWNDLFPPDQIREMLRAIDENGDQFETRHRRKDGTVYDVEVSVNGAIFSGQKLVLCVCRDITARKKAEEDLQQSEERYRFLADNASDVIWVYSLTERRYTYVSPAATRLYGCTLEEARNASLSDHLPPESLAIVQRVIVEIEQSDTHSPKRYSLGAEQVRKDGTRFWADISVSVIRDEKGQPVSVVGITRDVTARKLAEAKLEQVNDELRRLAARLHTAREEERSRLSMELHDEVGQTLSAARMDLAMLRSSLGGASVGKPYALADRIDTLLSECVSRLRGLETDLKPAMLEDLGLAAAIEWQMSEFTAHTGISYTISRLDDVTLSKEASLAVFRVFQEALSNIAQHACADAVDVSVHQGGTEVTVLVHDNGRGISEETVASPSPAGLVNMRERLRPFGGVVHISGAPGEGTTVRITIPTS